jgi:hypothetical protein
MKVLASAWFSALPELVRYLFFAKLVVDLLTDQPAQQLEILEGKQFQQLSNQAQAKLCRWIGMDYLMKPCGRGFAIQFLQRSVALCPQDRKSQVLLWTVAMWSPIVRPLLHGWRAIRRAQRHLETVGRPLPRPVPSPLQASAEWQ